MIVLLVVEVLLFGAFLASDLVSKHFVMPFLETNGDYVLIDKVITLTPAYNTGAGFSMLSGKTGWLIAITVVGLALLLAFTVYAHLKLNTKKKSTKFLLVLLMMMLAGGVGNLVDRVAYGYVRDFIDYTVVQTLFHRSFAICNVADIWLTVGMILLIVYVIFFWRDSNKKDYVEPAPDRYQVETAERLLSVDKEREVDLRQVAFKEDIKDEQAGEGASGTDAEAAEESADGEAQNAESKEDMAGETANDRGTTDGEDVGNDG